MGETEMKMDEQRAGSPKLRTKEKKGDLVNDAIASGEQRDSIEEQLEAVHNGVAVKDIATPPHEEEPAIGEEDSKESACEDAPEVADAEEEEEEEDEAVEEEEEEEEEEVVEDADTFNGDDGLTIESNEVEESVMAETSDKVEEEREPDAAVEAEEPPDENGAEAMEDVREEHDAKGDEELEEAESGKEGEEGAALHDEEPATEAPSDTASGKPSILEGALKNTSHDGEILHKVHVEDAREGCDGASPSSPGHAETASTCELDPCSDEVDKSPKRKSAAVDDLEPAKKLKKELQAECMLRNKILAEYTDALELNSFEQMQLEEEKLADEIQKLDDIAREKERQWNNVIHVKKMKEELLERVKRRKQVCMIQDGLEVAAAADCDSSATSNGQKAIAGRCSKQAATSRADMNGHDRAAARHKGPVRNVQSIIADYRQRHPETVPRRGRRIRNLINGAAGGEMSASGKAFVSHAGGAITFANMALGSGAHVRSMDASHSDIAMLLNSIENTHHEADYHESSAFKEFLETISYPERKKASAKQASPQLPEVTVHAVTSSSSTANVPTNSLLHGILTKNQGKGEARTTFSPTLARLLTAPDKAMANQQKAANVSISDILSTNNKTRSEITITPVANDYDDGHPRRKHQVQEEETEDSVDRLVIDENNELGDSRGDNTSDGGDEVPQCQGCNQKAAQFVCAGCGNQWYCSRECQVTAWDEHSDVCSG